MSEQSVDEITQLVTAQALRLPTPNLVHWRDALLGALAREKPWARGDVLQWMCDRATEELQQRELASMRRKRSGPAAAARAPDS